MQNNFSTTAVFTVYKTRLQAAVEKTYFIVCALTVYKWISASIFFYFVLQLIKSKFSFDSQ